MCAVIASHLRAAEITAERVSGLSYKIQLVLYADWENVKGNPNSTNPNPMERQVIQALGQNFQMIRVDSLLTGSDSYKTQMNVYELAQGTIDFPAPFAWYTVSFTEEFRNGGILNIQGGDNTDNIRLHVNTRIFVDGTQNSTPQLLIPPIDEAATGRVYVHNPGAYDQDGDSISYSLAIPQQGLNQDVPDYVLPDHASFGAGSNISIDPITGDLSWDTPLKVGIYNVAIAVTEWGTSPLGAFKKSVIIRDMQINVLDSDNNPPFIIAKNEDCIPAGSQYLSNYSGFDPDGDNLTVSFFGGMFDFNPPNNASFGAQFFGMTGKDSLILHSFIWTPGCELAREVPYSFSYKLTDDHALNLSTIHTTKLSVQLPAPQNVFAQTQNNEIHVNWDPYICLSSVSTFNIYRLECDTSLFVPDPCITGVLEEWGFVKIGAVNSTEVVFVDQEVEVGSRYCYVVTAQNNSGLESLVSNTSCTAFGLTLPLLTNVSVLSTDEVNGMIDVRWLPPLEIDTSIFGGPYTYELYRSDDIEGANFGTVPIFSYTIDSLKDSSYIDSGLNTEVNGYSYRVSFYDNGVLLGNSHISSYLRLEGISKFERVELNLSSRIAWQFPDSLEHIVYRDSAGIITKFDSLRGEPNGQAIEGLTNGEEYCFYIETKGVYCVDGVPNQPFINFSNTFCTTPDDFNPPCPPQLFIDTLDCETLTEETSLTDNQLAWINDFTPDNCENDLAGYNLYYQAPGEVEFIILEDLNDANILNYIHSMDNNRAGCYYITAIDLKGNESSPSNTVCNENCEFIEFPNIFTPNSDLKNDVFIPIPTPRNVKEIDFSVYNRLGKLVFRSTENPNIDWDGKSFSGEELSDGLYYYVANVTFFKLEDSSRQQVFNGWIYLVR